MTTLGEDRGCGKSGFNGAYSRRDATKPLKILEMHVIRLTIRAGGVREGDRHEGIL